MSLLSPRVRIALTPTHVAVADGGAYREAAVSTSGWAGALEALAGLLATVGRKRRVSVTLSQHFVQLHLLPPPPVRLNAMEMQGWIRDYLDRQFGEAGRDIRLAWQEAPPGEAFIASSMDPKALTELEARITAASLSLVQVQPWLAVAWNRQRSRLGRGRAWFALAEPERLTLAGLESGRAQSLRSIQTQGDPALALADLLTREALLAGETEPVPLWIESLLPSVNWQRVGGGRSVHPLTSGGGALSAMLE